MGQPSTMLSFIKRLNALLIGSVLRDIWMQLTVAETLGRQWLGRVHLPTYLGTYGREFD